MTPEEQKKNEMRNTMGKGIIYKGLEEEAQRRFESKEREEDEMQLRQDRSEVDNEYSKNYGDDDQELVDSTD